MSKFIFALVIFCIGGFLSLNSFQISLSSPSFPYRTWSSEDQQDQEDKTNLLDRTRTVISWSRKIQTCDQDGDFPIPIGATNVLYAYSDTKPTSVESPVRHDKKGILPLRLRNPEMTKDEKRLDSLKATPFELRFNKARVRIKEGTRWLCQAFELPSANEKEESDIIRWETINKTPANIHHMLVYECPDLTPEDVKRGPFGCMDGKTVSGDPLDDVFSNKIKNCLAGTLFSTWSLGGDDFNLPEKMGYRIGPKTTHYVILEVHYTSLKPDVDLEFVDSSGLRYYRTSTLQEHSVGILTTGLLSQSQLPIEAMSASHTRTSFCTSDCTKDMLKDNSIHIVATFLHAHQSAVKLSLQHITPSSPGSKELIELEPIAGDDVYNFEFQDYDFVYPPREVKPGDVLITSCKFDTSDRTDPTHFRIRTQDEMCFAFSLYYPRITAPSSECVIPDFDNIDPHWAETNTATCGNGKVEVTKENVDFDDQFIHYKTPECISHPPSEEDRKPETLVDFDHTHYDRHQYLDDDKKFMLHWKLGFDDETEIPLTISFAAEVAATGWIGLGINTKRRMIGADIALGWVDAEGKTNLHDRMAKQNAAPPLDGQQDFYAIKGTIFEAPTVNIPGIILPLVSVVFLLMGVILCVRHHVKSSNIHVKSSNIKYERVATGATSGDRHFSPDDVIELPELPSVSHSSQRHRHYQSTGVIGNNSGGDSRSEETGPDGEPAPAAAGDGENVSQAIAATLDGIADSLRELDDEDDDTVLVSSKENIRGDGDGARRAGASKPSPKPTKELLDVRGSDVYDDGGVQSEMSSSSTTRQTRKGHSKFDNVYD